MKFEKTSIPTLYGLRSISNAMSMFRPEDNINVFAIKPGIECIIANGVVCDSSGKPFDNDAFQARFKDFAEKLQKSNFVGVGRVVTNSKTTYRNIDHKKIYPIIGYKRGWNPSLYDNLFIELHDIHQPSSQYDIKFNTRLQVMEGMSRTSIPKNRVVFTPELFRGNTESVNEISKFVFEQARIGNTALFKSGNEKYIQGFQGVLKNFIIDAFEQFEGVVESVRESEKEVMQKGKICNIVDFIRVRHQGTLYPISMMFDSEMYRSYLSDMVSSGKIKLNEFKFKFKAIKIDGELKFPSKI